FIQLPPKDGIYRVNVDGGSLTTVPVLTNVTTWEQLFPNLIYVNVKLRRDLGLAVSPTRPGQRRISWNTVGGVTNTLEYSSVGLTNTWTVYTNLVGSGSAYSLIDASGDRARIYRVSLRY